MAEPLITQVFGAYAIQNADILQLPKTGLEGARHMQLVGLTPAAVNTAESMLVSILKIAELQLTQENFDLHPEQQIIITRLTPDTITRYGQTWNRRGFKVALHDSLDVVNIDPDIY